MRAGASLQHMLAKGNIVELGEFGNSWLKTYAEGADQISAVMPRFNPGREFKRVI